MPRARTPNDILSVLAVPLVRSEPRRGTGIGVGNDPGDLEEAVVELPTL